MSDALAECFPVLGRHVSKCDFADLPTPLTTAVLAAAGRELPLLIKHDEATSSLYGGNKVRKLEYLLWRALDRGAERVATYGTVASNHALATALFSRRLGLRCSCLLSHQARTAAVPRVLNEHLRIGTQILNYGGSREDRVRLMRQSIQGRRIFLIPPGGSNWLGAVGFVNAGLELARQLQAGAAALPRRIYVATGTMATAAGLALGLALGGMESRVQAVRVTHDFVANPRAMRRLVAKIATVLQRLDKSIPPGLADRVRLDFREEFFGTGYARSNAATDLAVAIARDQLGLQLETTYTGKAMAALLHDLSQPGGGEQPVLFWNTYNAVPLASSADSPSADAPLPAEFRRYFD